MFAICTRRLTPRNLSGSRKKPSRKSSRADERPIFCGGTGLYFKAFLDGLGEAPPADEKLRAELEAAPLEALLAELRERDPAAYEKIDRQNPRRVIRAVEVIRLTGKKFSEQRAEWKPGISGTARNAQHVFSASRVRRTICTGASTPAWTRCLRADWWTETRGLLQHGLAENKFAMQAIGYRQVVEHLRGERGLAETIELVKIRTRQFAKRQLTGSAATEIASGSNCRPWK